MLTCWNSRLRPAALRVPLPSGPPDGKSGEVRRALEGWPVRVEATGFAVHIMQPHLSKAEGAKRACALLDVDPRHCAAFGDNENDFPVFDIVGYRVAVANATPELKARADFVAPREYGDGVVDGLHHLGLV